MPTAALRRPQHPSSPPPVLQLPPPRLGPHAPPSACLQFQQVMPPLTAHGARLRRPHRRLDRRRPAPRRRPWPPRLAPRRHPPLLRLAPQRGPHLLRLAPQQGPHLLRLARRLHPHLPRMASQHHLYLLGVLPEHHLHLLRLPPRQRSHLPRMVQHPHRALQVLHLLRPPPHPHVGLLQQPCTPQALPHLRQAPPQPAASPRPRQAFPPRLLMGALCVASGLSSLPPYQPGLCRMPSSVHRSPRCGPNPW